MREGGCPPPPQAALSATRPSNRDGTSFKCRFAGHVPATVMLRKSPVWILARSVRETPPYECYCPPAVSFRVQGVALKARALRLWKC
jgi:hypothetical protein